MDRLYRYQLSVSFSDSCIEYGSRNYCRSSKTYLTEQYMDEKGLELAKKKPRYKEGDASVEGPVLWEGLFGSLEYTAIQNQERGTMLTVDYEDGREEK